MNVELNFLPWRQEIRNRKKKEYFFILQIISACAFVTAALVHFNYSSVISNQEERVNHIKNQITVIDAEINQIDVLKRDKRNVIERMKVIKRLEHDRPIVVHMFDDLTRLMPDGVYITSMDLKDDILNLKGVATSNTRISKLMRELDSSKWFAYPKLISVSAIENKNDTNSELEQENQFELTVMRSSINIDAIINEANLEDGK